MAAFCNISKEGFNTLLQIVYNHVMKDNYTDTKKLMLYIYDSIYKNNINNSVQALTYAGLVPRMLAMVALQDSVAKDKIRLVTTVDDLLDLKDRLLDDIGEVKKELFGVPSEIEKEEGIEIINSLNDTNELSAFEKLMSNNRIIEFLKQAENKNLFEAMKQKYIDLKKARINEILKNRAAAAAEREKNKAEGIDQPEEGDDLEEDEYEYSNEFLNLDEHNFEAVAYLTPAKGITNVIPYDSKSKPNDEISINPNIYDVALNDFMNKNQLTNSSVFQVTFEKDTEELIRARKFSEEDLTKALNNMGEVAVIRLKNGEIATFANTGFIKDKDNPLYNAPLVTSVNKEAFNKNIEYRAMIFAQRQRVSYAEAIGHYKNELDKLNAARDLIKRGVALFFPLEVIHQSSGIIETTDEGFIVDRFRDGDDTAMTSFRILKRDEKIRKVQFKRGQIVATIGTKQAFAASAPKIGDLRGDIGTQIKDAIDFYLYNVYLDEAEAKAIVKNFLKKVLYVKRNSIRIRVKRDITNNTYRILYEKKELKKEGEGQFQLVTQGQIDSSRINISEALLTSESLTIPSPAGDRIINASEYYDFVKENLTTNRKAVRNNDGSFYLDPTNAYFSFALPESLKGGVRILKSYDIEDTIRGVVRNFTINYLSNGTKEFLENGNTSDTLDLDLQERRKLVEKLEEREKNKKNEQPLNEEVKVEVEKIVTPDIEIVDTPITETVVAEELTPGKVITVKKKPINPMFTFKLSNGISFVINMNNKNPFLDAFNSNAKLKKIGLSKEIIEDIKSKLDAGEYSKTLVKKSNEEFYILGIVNSGEFKVFNNKLEVVPTSSINEETIKEFELLMGC